MLDKEFLSFLEEILVKHYYALVKIRSVRMVSGGSINNAYDLDCGDEHFFIKVNDAGRYPDMFETEAKGLALIKSTDEIQVPEVLEYGEKSNKTYLILRFIHSAPKMPDFWREFGVRLATMHAHSGDDFGLNHDNYIGSLRQYNNPHKSWTEFFIHERLLRQIVPARQSGLINARDVDAFESLFKKLPSIFPEEQPSLIHGDLWGGNYMTGENGQPVIIDPAVYYGNREMDLGMSKLFGGFDPRFYEMYHEVFPLQPGWKERLDICNLYPLMVHVNLFGTGYLGSVRSILQRF